MSDLVFVLMIFLAGGCGGYALRHLISVRRRMRRGYRYDLQIQSAVSTAPTERHTDICAALAADLADKPPLGIGRPEIIRP
jgi:hypothetical protein